MKGSSASDLASTFCLSQHVAQLINAAQPATDSLIKSNI